MDYEKKYNEALKRAKAAIDMAADKDLVKGVATTIFPELRESEDERIKKIITDSVFYQYGAGVEYKDVLDYLDKLEKQKDSLHVSETCKENAGSFTDEDEKLRKLVIDRIRTATEMTEGLRELLLDYLEKQKEPENTSASTMIPSCWEVEQKEQKPDTEQQVTEEQLHDLNEAIKGLRMDGCERMADSLHSLYNILERNKEPKPAEWSEEDEKNLELVIDCVYEFYPDPVMKYKLKDWLKSLRPQPKQEWSKEDEETLEKLHRLLIICRGEKKFIQEADYNKMDNLLKSLRPSWKPSEEQMKALQWWSELPSCSPGLKSLYEDLKKL